MVFKFTMDDCSSPIVLKLELRMPDHKCHIALIKSFIIVGFVSLLYKKCWISLYFCIVI